MKIGWIKDPKNKQESVTLTILVSGFFIALMKLSLSGMAFGDLIVFEKFTGMDFAAVLGAVGGLYSLRKHQCKDDNQNGVPDEEEGKTDEYDIGGKK